ncbi:hypothetical protein FSP39_015685 [Pinctada imbricata]|uniref:Uncharacterized protein n=1 Tax=Pinctada imbricata TaxID=66713 RepID=A0AA88XZK6_PINIB|nr:hypothetical protein FSP39_015685 [Pinctada imbricata]
MCDDLITAERAADTLKASPETTTLLRILDAADAQTNEIVEGRKENIKELEEGKKRETQTIASFREEVNRHLDLLEQGMKDELEKKHTQKTKELKKEVDTFQMNRNTIAYYRSLLELILRNGSGIQVLNELSKVAQQCQILEEKIHHRASKIKRVAYDVKQNDITSKMDSLGNIEFTHTAVVTTPAPEDWHKLRGKKSQAKAHPVRENTHDFLVIRYPSSKITGGTTMRSKLLLVDNSGREFRAYNEVGHRDENLTYIFKRNPWDITALPQRDGVDMVAVTMPNESIIEIIECGGTPVMEKHHYSTRNNCYGITYVEGQVIVACQSGLEIFELIEDHKLVSRSFLRMGSEKIQYVHAVDKSRFYYTDSADRGSLFCITPDGTEIFEYCNSNLRKPTGISTDSKGNVYVAGYHSNNIHQLSPEGALIHVITPRSRTFYKPTVLIEHENRMYSVFGKHKVIVFT